MVDTTTNYKLQWDSCRSAQSSAQWIADTLGVDFFAVEHRTWWGKKWRIGVLPTPPPEPPEEEYPESKRPELPRT